MKQSGELVGPYRIIRPIGKGGFGYVHLAENVETGQQVALKIVYADPNDPSGEDLRLEEQGALLQQKLAIDTRIVPVFDIGHHQCDLYIAMEFVDGPTLERQIEEGMPPERAGRIAAQLCDVLDDFSRFEPEEGKHGVCHGDLKPGNIFVVDDSRIRLLDFGTAKALSASRKHSREVGRSLGYCSPERLISGTIDTQSDLWSVGVLLYQMISGRLPFNAPTPEETTRLILGPSAAPPLANCPEAPSRVALRMLHKSPDLRFPSAAAARDALNECLMIMAGLADGDATVRTQMAPDDNATRRSSPHRPLPPPVRRTAPKPRFSWRLPRIRLPKKAVLGAGAAAAVLLSFGAYREMEAWEEAGQLKRELQSEAVRSAGDAWKRYEGISEASFLPFARWRVRGTLLNRLLESADRPIREYRTMESVVFQSDWQQALEYFQEAILLDPGNNSIRGRLRLCEAHLDRIGKRLSDAELKFRESAELLKAQPDPWLGLLRLYSVELHDMDKAEDALRKAEAYGHKRGKKECVLLADGLVRRARQLRTESRQYREMPNMEEEQLLRAAKDYARAIDLLRDFDADVNATRKKYAAQREWEAVQDRLDVLTGQPTASTPGTGGQL